MPNFKICFCFSDTGGGHRSAAEAIEAAIENVQHEKLSGDHFHLTEENVIEKTHPLNRGFVDLYNFLLRHNQAAMRYYYWFIETFRPNNSDIGYQIAKPWLEKFIYEQKSDVIVSAHPMCNHYLARILKDTGMAGTIKLITVVTDPNGKFWRGWACLEADLTLVPNGLGAAQLIEWGVSADKIKVVGMPVHPDFSKPPLIGRQEFLESLHLHPGKLTVCLNAGWAGGGNMVHIYRQLAQADKDIQVIFLCGHNTRLYEQMRREALKYDMPTHVLPFHDRIADLMSAVDLMVTKAGGLTTFEALARKLPLAFDLITKPMPQEIGTVDLLVEQNLASEIKKPEDILQIVMDLKPVQNREEMVLPAVHQLDKIYASEEIARWIMSFCDKSYAPASASTTGIHDSSQGAVEQSSL
jgi:UDP-N-acetylglucosamine:LPS N-acetylglucosamine transferase